LSSLILPKFNSLSKKSALGLLRLVLTPQNNSLQEFKKLDQPNNNYGNIVACNGIGTS